MINFNLFVDFCKSQLETGDFDAHIPFLKELCGELELTKEQSVWMGLLYMGYYNEACAYTAFKRPGVKQKKVLPPMDLPIETQRRNLYGGRIRRHFEDLYTRSPHLPWLEGANNWEDLLSIVGSVYGNGRWARYTTSELLTHLGRLPYEPDCFEILESSGPRAGLHWLGLEPSEMNAMAVLRMMADEGVKVSVSQLESLLCDWAGMNKGTFYAGRNIDRQQGRIIKVAALLGSKVDLSLLYVIRKRVFPGYSRGESNGWQGIDKKRLKAYKETGKVLHPGEDR